MAILTSAKWHAGTGDNRNDPEASAVSARRALLEADLVVEGASPATVARLATPTVAARMLAHERNVVALVGELFTGVGAGLK